MAPSLVSALQILLGIVLLLADGGVPGTEAGPMSCPSLPIRVAGSQNPA
jgi:hypothetical protein